ncbi:heme ABC exporter ATP-binding protein CcmA [Ignicoccus hospitalis]|uniref:ABC transporter related n=1 Tax=Ignicoccus hospitalis (strain KIN4/I / DSM 18386 / JCM 14125) TaxID=453591 RepID=A8ABG0_IGNH4|nr:heme ABC exporter ATP-binding protein CcmA [Ignicoccus hospitalis]ABU82262.1 ABC transporter related [Ignicoccus hospitalis KIN4/I]HIH90819.1 heme ABC exporter ATP-binding protein CcmA [Desulfurococcaceae archaeon]
MPAVEVKDVWRSFGKKTVLRGVSFEVEEGEVFGLLGPNGAGKTTTLRIITGILKPDKGDIIVYGKSVVREREEVRRMISYLPEESDVYLRLTGYENLKFFAMIYFDDPKEREEAIEEGIKIANLGDAIHNLTKTYSKGMRRRLALARTLMVRPKLAILDEPTSGLDVYSSIKVRDSIKEFVKKTGASVILSSHNMLEVEYLCDRVAFIVNGKIITIGSPEELKREFNAKNLEEAFVKATEVGEGAA